MAKQSGLHQLRGKVGEHSYYRQTGIASGLVRSINQGMSSRVKNDAAFLNTRLNNAEFGQAGRLASVLAMYIKPKFRPMVLPFSQSKMAKIILEFIKTDTTSPWGQRNVTTANSGEMQVSALNSVVKNRFEDFGLALTVDEENSVLSVEASVGTQSKLSAIEAAGFDLIFVASSTWIGTFVQSTGKYASSFARANTYQENMSNVSEGDEVNINYVIPNPPPAGWPAIYAEYTGVLVVLPYRQVNGTNHYLQEHCTFKAFQILDGPVS